ncbi:U2 small nuclear ribonucleoprotein auxiliary factor 35 kDa subunit-related protein 2 [Mactra antiquata]
MAERQGPSVLSHKQRKALIKKEKRKLKRQAEAKKRDEDQSKEEAAKKNSPCFAARLAQEIEEEKATILQIEAESQRQRELWEWHEELYKQKLKRKAEQEEHERLQKIEIEKKIKEEWEERQKKEKEEEEEKKKKKEKQEELLKQARDAENKDSDWSNPLAPVQYGRERQIENCPFFAKVAACRFGDRCSRSHPYPDSSKTILFAGMFRHFQLDQGLCEEYDTDIVLEYEDNEVYQKFNEFYEDTLPEFKAIGHVTQFKVCCNFQPHLRGNVYISYSREDHAFEALTKFNARWYGGKQLSAQFVEIPSWRRAICGLFGRGKCPKGRECNFLHIFKNPSNEFNMADKDMVSFTPHHNHRHSNRHRSRSRSYSPPRSSHRKRYSRSKSPERHRRSRSSRHYSKYRTPSPKRTRERSRSPEYRSHHRSSRRDSRSPDDDYYGRQRSRSRDRKKKSKKSKHSKHQSQSPERNKNHKKSKTESKSDKNNVKVSSVSEDFVDDVGSDSDAVWVENTVDDHIKRNSSKYDSTNRKYRSKYKPDSSSDEDAN